MNRDNQQEIPTEGEIAWLAGIIECDGSVMLSCHIRNEKHSKPKIGTEIKIYNTDAGIITKVVDILTRLNMSHYISERLQKPMDMKNGKSYGDKTKPMLSVAIKNIEPAYFVGKLLLPWMSGEKKHRLLLMTQYLARRLEKIEINGGNKRTPLDRGDCELIIDFYRRFVKRKGHNGHLVEAILNDFT